MNKREIAIPTVLTREQKDKIKEIYIRDWHFNLDETKAFEVENSKAYKIEFLDDTKQIIIEGVTFDIVESKDLNGYIFKPNSSRFKKRTIKSTYYQNLKYYLVEGTFESLFVDAIRIVIEKALNI